MTLAMCFSGKAGKVTGSIQRTASSKAASAASHLSGLWTKAPPKKQQANPEPPKPAAGIEKGRAVKASAPAPAADAEAALRAAHEVHSTPRAFSGLCVVHFRTGQTHQTLLLLETRSHADVHVVAGG